MEQDGNNFYYFANAHGDITGIVSPSIEVMATYDYDEFGNLTEQTGNFANSLRYAAEFYDSESENYYLRSRYYDPTVGRFTQQDSFLGMDTNPLSLNRYTYCHNNPIRYIDPSGHYTEYKQHIEGFGDIVYDGEFASSADDEKFGRYLYQFKQGKIGAAEFFRQTSGMGVNVGIQKMYCDISETSMLDIQFETAVSYETAQQANRIILDGGNDVQKQLSMLSSEKITYAEISACIDSLHYKVWILYLAGLYGGTAEWRNDIGGAIVSVAGKNVTYKHNGGSVSVQNGKMFVCTDRFFSDFDVPNIFSWKPDDEYGYAAYINLDERSRKYFAQNEGIKLNTDYSGDYKILSGVRVNEVLIGNTTQDEFYFYGEAIKNDTDVAFCYPLTEQNQITQNVYYADIRSLQRNGVGLDYAANYAYVRYNFAKGGAYIQGMIERESKRVRPIMGGIMASAIVQAGTWTGSDWYYKDGTLHYPPNDGAVRGTEKTATLKAGEKVGRYGGVGPRSDYVTKAGTSWKKLSLPPHSNTNIYNEYIIKKDISNVIKSKVAPWGDSSGGGWQYKLSDTIQYLIDNGFLEEIIK